MVENPALDWHIVHIAKIGQRSAQLDCFRFELDVNFGTITINRKYCPTKAHQLAGRDANPRSLCDAQRSRQERRAGAIDYLAHTGVIELSEVWVRNQSGANRLCVALTM